MNSHPFSKCKKWGLKWSKREEALVLLIVGKDIGVHRVHSFFLTRLVRSWPLGQIYWLITLLKLHFWPLFGVCYFCGYLLVAVLSSFYFLLTVLSPDVPVSTGCPLKVPRLPFHWPLSKGPSNSLCFVVTVSCPVLQLHHLCTSVVSSVWASKQTPSFPLRNTITFTFASMLLPSFSLSSFQA